MAECCCGSDDPVKLLYACSGAANTGYLADNAARRLAVMTDFGVEKGKTEIIQELIAKTAFTVYEKIADE